MSLIYSGDWFFFRSIFSHFNVFESTRIDWLAVQLKRIRSRAADRKLTKWITVLRASTHFSLVERVFCIGFARFQPLPPPPPTTVTTDPSRLIYVFAGAKLSYFIIARAIVATLVCIDMPLFRRRGGFVRLGVKNSHDTSGGFYKFLSLLRLNNAITNSTLYSSRDIIFFILLAPWIRDSWILFI